MKAKEYREKQKEIARVHAVAYSCPECGSPLSHKRPWIIRGKERPERWECSNDQCTYVYIVPERAK